MSQRTIFRSWLLAGVALAVAAVLESCCCGPLLIKRDHAATEKSASVEKRTTHK